MAAALTLAGSFIGPWEGKATVGYLDIVGVPTYCYGGTGPKAVVGKHYTSAECQAQKAEDVRRHAEAIEPCLHVEVPPPALAAFISLSYNIGAASFCRSSVAADANAGHLAAACDAILLYNRAGGHYVRGLANRRAAERGLCKEAL